jgi:hypothetical protein
MIATCKLVHYHYQHKNVNNKEKYPVRLRVTFKRQSKYFSLRISITPPEFKKLLTTPSLKDEFQHLVHFLGKAESIAKELRENFTWEEFENLFFVKITKISGPIFICDSIAEYAEMVKIDGRLKTYASHMTTLNKINLLNKSKPLLISSINKEWLTNFADFLRNMGCMYQFNYVPPFQLKSVPPEGL